MNKFCAGCGNAVVLGAQFCGGCGTKIVPASQADVAPKAERVLLMPDSSNKKLWIGIAIGIGLFAIFAVACSLSSNPEALGESVGRIIGYVFFGWLIKRTWVSYRKCSVCGSPHQKAWTKKGDAAYAAFARKFSWSTGETK